MPLDTKRICGPESSFPPSKFSVISDNVSKKTSSRDSGKTRADGRQRDEMRPFFLRVGVVTQAKGSAYIELDKTKVICAVYGPREVSKLMDFSINGKIYCEFKYAPFACRLRRQHQQDSEEKELSQVLKQALEPAVCLYKFPKSQVDVYVTVLDNDGGAFSGAITAAGAALANAGIPLYDLLVGCSLRFLLLDPTTAEEEQSIVSDSHYGNMTLALMPSLQQITCLVQDGIMKKDVLVQALKTLTDSCHQLHQVLQHVLLKNWRMEVKEKLKADE